ncbi:response regulator [Nostoc sp. 2RC]|uniref:hybrid sensor histidine kinase/response regulator n=1 Tax=Nostoc sp. 2RC TaxID=2485484 RepID=UPI001628EF1C|nr:response regulator [Nostoc sp. 2RC]MBC1237081.1 response regulator [Nostoc sp. 2RC]
MLPEQQQRILGYFIEEARDHLNTIEQGLLNLESTLNDPEMISEVFRAAHSIKGGAAMLGLTSIQHTSHRLEDCFKVLKEHPVQVDEKLESLFLGVSDTLKALLEHLSGPYGLSEETANTLMSETEPVFQWLNEHLEQLVEQGNSGAAASSGREQGSSVENVSTLTELFLRRDIPNLTEEGHQESEISFAVAPQEVLSTASSKENRDWSDFQTQVLQTLREMLQLFKQTTTSSTRQNLQECCHQLVKLGESWNLSNWCSLCQAAASAIANPENTYLTLAKIVITEIKQAQELVLQGKEAEIAISEQLKALLTFAEIELSEITSNLVSEQSPAKSNAQETEDAQEFITNFSEPIEQLNLEELQQTSPNHGIETSFSFTPHEEVHPISKNLDPNGPEVGIAELNTLADLFEGETPDLDEPWHQEETLEITSSDELGINFNNNEPEDSDGDLSDLLSFDEDTSNEQQTTTTAKTEDLSLLFGDNFLDKENSELRNQQIPVTNLELNDINELDFNLDADSEAILSELTEQKNPDIVPNTIDDDNDVVADLLSLTLDEPELLIPGEVTQPENDTFASIELSSNQENTFNNLFLETENKNWVEEITPNDYVELSQTTDLSLDNLFGEPEEHPVTPNNDSEIGDLFDITSIIDTSEFSPVEDDLSNFWSQENTEEKSQNELESLVEPNLENFLEENLFTASNDDIFNDNQNPQSAAIGGFDIEDFHLDLTLSSDAGDDLFEESTLINSTIIPEINQVGILEESAPLFASDSRDEEIHSSSQQPETVDFIPEFTNQLSEISAVDATQTSSDLEPLEENPQLLFEDVAVDDSTYIQMEIPDDVVAELSTPELSPGQTEDLFGSFAENPQLLFEDVAVDDSTYMQMETPDDVVAELSTLETSGLSPGQTDDLFGSFAENPQLLFEDVAVDDSTYIQMETPDDVVAELSTLETSELSPGQTDDLFGSFAENPQLLFEDVAVDDSTYIQMETPDDVVAELSTLETSELSPGQTDDLFGSFAENPQLLFEDVAVDDSTYIQMETPDDVVAELSILENSTLFDIGSEVLDPENNNLETTLEFAENTNLENQKIGFINDLLASAENLATNELTKTISSETGETDSNREANLLNLAETSEAAPVLESENAVAVTEELIQTQTVEEVTSEDEFANLEALLGEKIAPLEKPQEMPEVDFAALEELLGTDNNQAAVSRDVSDKLRQHQPLTQPVPAKTPPPAPRVDEFSDLEKLLAEADQTISHSALTKPNTTKTPRPSTRRTARFEETMKVPVKQLDDMSNLVGELVVNRNTLEQDHERLRQSLDNLLIQVQQLSDVGARMQELYERSLLEASLLAGRKAKESGVNSQDSNSDRGFSELEMDRFTPFHTLSQQMIERIVRVRESASDIDFVTEETERVARQFRQVTTQLQEGLTRARMVPFAQTIDRWRRGVRDNAIKCGKQVELVIEGGDTLIDKMILDHLSDPLTHMLNNAIAHGIETPEQRQGAGKPPVGIITIRAFHQGNQTVISVGDDGAGIDPARVKAKAVKIGMITEAQAKTISRLEVYDLLFQSGFSIKDQADEISGRGVGMDVVRSAISEIRGTVNTDSAIGKGTTFTIRLPLTLSICKALCCVSDRARIAFPMDGVEDTLDIPMKNIQHNTNGQSFISWRDTLLPFRPLKELLTFNRQISRGNVYGGNRDDDMVSVVVVRSANTLIALQIDLVLSEQEIVIKQFEGPAPKPIGVAGATVLGDGRIMPIADVLEIIDIFQGRISTQIGGSSWQQKASSTDAPATKIDPTVLIVDDSITVRELLSLTFNKAGYRVEQARDGQEAWDKLRSGLPCDIVFCDIEMPRCDGLELLSRIQKDSNLNHLPIAMLTSRGADKHRQMAVQLGASGYFTKPYLEEALLEAASRMLKGEKLVS